MRITGFASSSTKRCRRWRRRRRRRRRRCRPFIFVSMTSAAGERQIEVLVSGCWESSLNNYMRAAEATRLQTGQPGLLRRCHNGQAEHIPPTSHGAVRSPCGAFAYVPRGLRPQKAPEIRVPVGTACRKRTSTQLQPGQMRTCAHMRAYYTHNTRAA